MCCFWTIFTTLSPKTTFLSAARFLDHFWGQKWPQKWSKNRPWTGTWPGQSLLHATKNDRPDPQKWGHFDPFFETWSKKWPDLVTLTRKQCPLPKIDQVPLKPLASEMYPCRAHLDRRHQDQVPKNRPKTLFCPIPPHLVQKNQKSSDFLYEAWG